MSDNDILLKVSSKYIFEKIFSFLEDDYYLLKLIKYNKKFQKKFEINFEDSIINYQYSFKTKEEIFQNKLSNSKSNISYLSLSAILCLKYSYYFPDNIKENNLNIFLIKYKGLKINDYPLPSNFNSLNFKDKINILIKNEYFYEYTLNDEQMEIINLINKIREMNKIKKLIYFKNEKLYDYFKKEKSDNEKLLFIFPIGKFKNHLFKNYDDFIKILSNKSLNKIMIFENGKKEYIFIYSDYYKKTISKISPELINKDSEMNKKNKNIKFHLINNTIPELKLNSNSSIYYLNTWNLQIIK